MRFLSPLVRAVCAGLLLFSTGLVQAQNQRNQYNSLLWEITGNGLSKPSYLFGTMHISNKMVFHLSDSFYMGIRNADVVAIELHPEAWQSEIPRMNKQGEVYKNFNTTYYTDYLTENSFREGSFEEQLQESLRFEPALNDALLYRNESSMDNFQEDTYLDLYIYQTGKKLGKKTTGVETFMGAQRMMIEAYVDMSNDKNKKNNIGAGRYFDIGQVMQDAYRRGDLDMLDSINRLTEYSKKFTEKFLYQRNVIQANSMDSIMKTQSLFVGVGAAHLPGQRGVIELLREKGYKLRPVFMMDRDATQKNYIDSLTVPVNFIMQYAPDSFYQVSVPGILNDIESKKISLKHYADMANGAYYLVTRIKTNTLFNGYREDKTLKLIDSLLYDNIPGTIISRNAITQNGYKGWDIINRTRKADVQHYRIFVTGSELLIFKMGGKGKYVLGKEAEQFFNSIRLKERPLKAEWAKYSPSSGGFSIQMPARPEAFYVPGGGDNLPEWKYEATDPETGDIYAVFRKSIYSFDFIETDTFDLTLIEESFSGNPVFEKKISRKTSVYKGHPVVDVVLKAKGGDLVQARCLIYGPQYYLLVCRSGNKESKAGDFFNSFSTTPYVYPPARTYTDSMLRFTVNTPVQPVLDSDMMDMMLYIKKNEQTIRNKTPYYSVPENNNANFISEQTGEVIIVNAYLYPDYYYIKDSVEFWKDLFRNDSTLQLSHKQRLEKGTGTNAWMLHFSDTASSRIIKKLVLQKGHTIITANTVVDSLIPESTFIRTFYGSINTIGVPASPDIFTNKLDLFKKNFFSQDTVARKKARAAIPSLYYGKEGYPLIIEAMKSLNANDRDYYELRNKFITELGFIRDSSITKEVAQTLKKIYLDAGDTTLFQNSALAGLARLQDIYAAEIFKELVLLDPPAFESKYEYVELFNTFRDTLKIAPVLYPELMNLANIEDFKDPVRSILALLVDSNYIDPSVYEDYVGNIYFDAKIALKKMQNAAESAKGKYKDDDSRDNEDNANNDNDYSSLGESFNSNLEGYISLLMPYYDKNPNLPKFFDKLLQSGNNGAVINTALAMVKYKRPVADSIWTNLAKKQEHREYLLSRLKQAGRSDLFPAKYRTKDMLSSNAVYAALNGRLDTLTMLSKKNLNYKGQNGIVYFYKYKVRKSEDWKIAISGLLEDKDKELNSDGTLFTITDKKLSSNTPVTEQLEEQLKRLIISLEDSGSQFYEKSYGNSPVPPPGD